MDCAGALLQFIQIHRWKELDYLVSSNPIRRRRDELWRRNEAKQNPLLWSAWVLLLKGILLASARLFGLSRFRRKEARGATVASPVELSSQLRQRRRHLLPAHRDTWPPISLDSRPPKAAAWQEGAWLIESRRRKRESRFESGKVSDLSFSLGRAAAFVALSSPACAASEAEISLPEGNRCAELMAPTCQTQQLSPELFRRAQYRRGRRRRRRRWRRLYG